MIMLEFATILLTVSGYPAQQGKVLQGQGQNGDWTVSAPGVRHRITVKDLPKPFVSRSVDRGPKIAPRPQDAWPKAPAGFKVQALVTGLQEPRAMATAPNGDIFIAESHPNRVRIVRDANNDGKPEINSVFASHLSLPF